MSVGARGPFTAPYEALLFDVEHNFRRALAGVDPLLPFPRLHMRPELTAGKFLPGGEHRDVDPFAADLE